MKVWKKNIFRLRYGHFVSNFVKFRAFSCILVICWYKMFYKSAEKSYFYTISTPVNLNFSVEQYYTQHMHARAIYSFGAIWYKYSLLIPPPLLSFFVCFSLCLWTKLVWKMVWRHVLLHFWTRNPFFDATSFIRYAKLEKFNDFVSEIYHLKLSIFLWKSKP